MKELLKFSFFVKQDWSKALQSSQKLHSLGANLFYSLLDRLYIFGLHIYTILRKIICVDTASFISKTNFVCKIWQNTVGIHCASWPFSLKHNKTAVCRWGRNINNFPLWLETSSKLWFLAKFGYSLINDQAHQSSHF